MEGMGERRRKRWRECEEGWRRKWNKEGGRGRRVWSKEVEEGGHNFGSIHDIIMTSYLPSHLVLCDGQTET